MLAKFDWPEERRKELNMTIFEGKNGDDQKPNDFSKTLAKVSEALGKLKFGTINLTVHENKIVQLDVTERIRFND